MDPGSLLNLDASPFVAVSGSSGGGLGALTIKSPAKLQQARRRCKQRRVWNGSQWVLQRVCKGPRRVRAVLAGYDGDLYEVEYDGLGFFKKLKKLGKNIVKGVGKVASVVAPIAAPILAVAAPGLAPIAAIAANTAANVAAPSPLQSPSPLNNPNASWLERTLYRNRNTIGAILNPTSPTAGDDARPSPVMAQNNAPAPNAGGAMDSLRPFLPLILAGGALLLLSRGARR